MGVTYLGVNLGEIKMAVLKLVGANRYMNKKASPIVILRDGLTDDIKDEALVASLLNAKRIDTLNNEHPMFELVSDTAKAKVAAPVVPEVPADPDPVSEGDEPVEVEQPKPAVKPKATRKKATRSRSN